MTSPPLVLYQGVCWTITADPSGLRLSSASSSARQNKQSDATSTDDLIGIDLGILLEQGLANDEGNGALLPWSAWPSAHALGLPTLTRYSTPSHLALRVDRRGEVGRPDFRYVVRWLEGHREVAVERHGAYLLHPATSRVMHLEPRMLALVEATDGFNRRPEAERTQPPVAWRTLGAVQQLARQLGMVMDSHLTSNEVVTPGALALDILQDEGSITFRPRLAGNEYSDAFASAMGGKLKVDPVEAVTLPGQRRLRVVLDEDQQEVLRRIKGVRKVRGPDAERLLQHPEAAFDGVAHAIDLEYGPRVIGVGAVASATNTAVRGDTVFDRMGVVLPTPAAPAAPEPLPPPGERSRVVLEVLDAESGERVPLRLDAAAIESLHHDAKQALQDGRESVTCDGRPIRVEAALVEALSRHLAADGKDERDYGGEVGDSGHLYLLINDHEETLTPALVPQQDRELVPTEVEVRLPQALRPEVQLKPHQEAGLRWLATCRAQRGRRGAILADDMGLGKTLQLLAHVASLVEAGELNDSTASGPNGPWRPVLVVAPLLLVETGTWTEEMRNRFADDGRVFAPWLVLRDEGITKVRHASGDRDFLRKPLLDPAKLMAHKVVITTYETVLAYQHSLAQLVDGRPLWSLVVYDEAQEVKSPTAKQSHAAKALASRFAVAATGTPVETRLRDLWNLMDTAEPGRLGTQRDFVVRYERPAMNARTPEARAAALEALRGAMRYEQPGALLLRRDKGILTGLPTRTDHRIACPMTSAERDATAGIMQRMAASGKRGGALAVMQQLHLVSQHPILAGGEGSLHDVPALLRDSARLQGLLGVLGDIRGAGEKALVFARSVDAQRLLAHVIGRHFGIPVDVLNGQTGVQGGSRQGIGAARTGMLKRFRNTPGFAVIVLSPFVAGVGITLTEANHVIHYGRWWNPAVENQATDRAYRIGQTRPVHVYYLNSTDPQGVVPRTLDEALDELLGERNALARDFLMPTTEDLVARAVARSLVGSAPTGSPTGTAGSGAPLAPATVGQAVSLAVALARHRGERLAWLGHDGLLGVQLLTRKADGVTCWRLADRVDDSAGEILQAAADGWSRQLGVPCTGALLISVGAPPREPRVVSWHTLGAEAQSAGLPAGALWDKPTPATTVAEVRQQLGIGPIG